MLKAHKSLPDQVVLITGASSGIGRQSALRFAEAGAKVVAVARSEEGLSSLVGEIEQAGGEAIFAVADVANFEQLKLAAEAAIAEFGRIDTWVNNAGVGLYTKILEADVADDRRLFETNFWGIVNGSRIAVPHLKAAGGGALINVGSVTSDMGAPVQTMYTASKHAVMAFTDGLREELMADKEPITVTLIKPSAINTPFTKHAKNNFDKAGTLPPPLYATDTVADQILYAAEYGPRDLYAGGGGRLMVMLGRHFPKFADRYLSSFGIAQQLSDRPVDRTNEALHETRGAHDVKGEIDQDHIEKPFSLYNLATRHPVAASLAVVAGVSLMGALATAEVSRGSKGS